MLSFLFTVIMLTLLLSVTAGFVFVLRKSVFKGKESGMYYVWLAVLILALVPVKIGEPRVILFPQENPQIENNNTQNTMVKLSELLKYTQPSEITYDIQDINTTIKPDNKKTLPATDINAKPENNIDILKLISENKEKAISVLLIIWSVGFIFTLVKTTGSYIKMKTLFYRESGECADEKINNILDECLENIGLKRQVNLRIMKWSFASPCVCGLFRPTIFIDGDCVSLSAKKLKYILIHELYHIKRYDMLYKILSVIVAAVHWFNPLTYKVIKTIDEDCELSVDRYVMSVFGNEQSDYYMNIILDIAERKCAIKNRPLVNIPYTSLFFGEKRNLKFLKRRYDNMKNTINKKHLIITLAVFLAVMIPMNTIIMSSCGITGTTASAQQPENNVSTVYYDSNVYEAALRMYFGLLPDEEITQEQLEEITEISIVRGIDTGGTMTDNINGVDLDSLTPVSFIINDRSFNMVPSIVHKRFFEEYILEKIGNYFETYGEDSRARIISKLNAYYAIKDPNAPDVSPRAREEMFIDYPITKDFAIAAFDPNASIREYQEILSYFAATGLLDDNFVENYAIDAAYLTRLPNLQFVSAYEIVLQNINLLDDSVVILQNYSGTHHTTSQGENPFSENYPAESYTEVTQNSSEQQQGPSGIFTPPNYGMNIDENGIEYLEFENQSLQAAVMEYLGIDYWEKITSDMLSQITSINAVIREDYNHIYDDKDLRDEFNLNCQYIEYTINGKTLDILSEFYAGGGLIESSLERESIDELKYLDKVIDEIVDTDDESYELYHYVPKADLTTEDKLSLYDALARQASQRISVYIDNDGNYFTMSENPAMFALGFTARYYDKAKYDATDTAYFPNLQEFNIEGISVKK